MSPMLPAFFFFGHGECLDEILKLLNQSEVHIGKILVEFLLQIY